VSGSNWPAFGLTGCAAPFSPFHRFGIDIPNFCRALARCGSLFGRLRHHDRGRDNAAAAGEVGEADGRGVADQDRYPLVIDAEQLGADVGDRGARAADVGMTGGDDDIAVLGDVDLRRGFAAGVEPEAGGDAPALHFAERRGVMRMRLRRLQRLDIADARKHRPERGFCPLPRGILQPQFERIHLQRFRRVRRARTTHRPDRARRAIGRDLERFDSTSKPSERTFGISYGAKLHRRARGSASPGRARLQVEHAVRGDDGAVLLAPI
jgi:hypothetical protein